MEDIQIIELFFAKNVQALAIILPQFPSCILGFLSSRCRYLSLKRLDWQQAAKRNAEVVALMQEMEQCIPDSLRNSSISGKEIRRVMDTFLESLSIEKRLIFLRHYLYVDTAAEISQRYGISERKVRNQLHRLRDNLNEHLKKEGMCI